MKPAMRSLVLGLLLVLGGVAVAVAGVMWQTDRTAQTRSLLQLKQAGVVEGALQAARLQVLQARAETLAVDSAFVDYVAQSLIPNPQRGGAVDSASISDLLQERRHGYDIAAVLDRHGKLVATSGTLRREPAAIQQDPLVTTAINTLKPVQGMWVDHGQLLWVAVNPLLRGVALQGVLLTATHVDDAFAKSVGRIAGVDVAFVISPSLGSTPAPSSGVHGWVAQALATQSNAVLGLTNNQTWQLADGGHSSAAWVTPIDTAAGRAALVAVEPDASAGGDANNTAGPLLLGIGVLGALGVLAVLWQWRRTWLPLEKLADSIELASKAGRHPTMHVEGSPIVRRLGAGINQLPPPNQPPIPTVTFNDLAR